MAENTKEEEQPAEKPIEKPSKLIPMILIANTLLMGGVLAVVLLRKSPAVATADAQPAHAAKAGEKGKADGQEAQAKPGPAHEEGAGEGGGAAEPVGAPGPILKLENFIIQLRGTDTDRYVRVAFDLELAGEAERSAVQSRMPHVRDAIISYFSDRSLDELRGSEGMERVKTAVLKRLDEIVGAKRVRAVFITELVIQ
jgi:flagellar FliL protein